MAEDFVTFDVWGCESMFLSDLEITYSPLPMEFLITSDVSILNVGTD